MKQRVISALIMVPILAFVYLGNYFLMGLSFIISVLALREFYKAFEANSPQLSGVARGEGLTEEAIEENAELLELDSCGSELSDISDADEEAEEAVLDSGGDCPVVTEEYGPRQPRIKPAYWVGYLGIVLLYLIEPLNVVNFIFVWVFIIIALTLFGAFRYGKRGLTYSTVTVMGLIYVVLLFYHAVMTGFGTSWVDSLGNQIPLFSSTWFAHWDYGLRNPLWLAIIVAYGTDIFAYFTGVLFGRHKLAPEISPQKTIEGSIGGIIGSTALCTLYGHFLLPGLFYDSTILHFIIIGVVGSILAQLGDLTGSLIKRNLGIKDFGNLIPGHGGILDRIDSLLFTAPFVFHYLNIYGFFMQIVLGQPVQ